MKQFLIAIGLVAAGIAATAPAEAQPGRHGYHRHHGYHHRHYDHHRPHHRPHGHYRHHR